jgi:diacylglycerol kinase (ATP)
MLGAQMSAALPFQSLAVVLNPQAGRGLAARSWPQLELALRASGLPYRLLDTGSAAQALAQVSVLPPGVAVLAVGGDGTVSSLLPALVGTGRCLGVAPLGTGNDFAGMLGLRPGDFGAALSRLRRAPRAADALRCAWPGPSGLLRERWLLNGLGMGFDAAVAARLQSAPARLSGLVVPGFGRYLWAALSALRDLQVVGVEVRIDGELLYAGPSCLVAVMNGTRYGGGFRISPHSDAFDGQLNVVLGGRVSRLSLLGLMLKVLRVTHLSDARVHCRSGSRVSLRWNAPTPAHLDGELIGAQEELSVEVLPGAVQFLSW